uniref:(California timema) hypothetical protein n=1 Tax=Timema californicum TaxID=61474 RepID=A0A7R9JFK9_TIMCA|nr:unnamed protein product [Timema californicum]
MKNSTDVNDWKMTRFHCKRIVVNIYKTAEEMPMDMSPDSGINELQGLSPEEQERQKQEWQQELIKERWKGNRKRGNEKKLNRFSVSLLQLRT